MLSANNAFLHTTCYVSHIQLIIIHFVNMSTDDPWIWKYEKMFGSATHHNFIDQAFNGTNATAFGLEMAPQQSPADNSIENIFSITTGIILIVNLLFSIKKKEEIIKPTKPAEKTNKTIPLRLNLIYFSISCLLSPITILLLTVFFIYRSIVSIILKIQYPKSYGGLLEGSDVVWAIEHENSKSVITIFVQIESEKNDNIYEKMKHVWTKLCKKYEKFTYHKDKKYGYYYWIRKRNININEHVKKINIDENNIEEVLGRYCNKSLPENHNGLWEILIGDTDSIKNGKKITPAIFRVHHTIGDGVGLVKLLLESIQDKNDSDLKSTQKREMRSNLIEKLLFTIIYHLFFIFMGPGFAIYQFVIKLQDDNALHGPQLTGKKIISWVEEKDYSTLNAVKKIKKRLNGVSFSEIILTVLSAAFCEYMEKKSSSHPVPEYVTVVVPVHMNTLKTTEQIRVNGNVTSQRASDTCHLANRFSMTMFNLPIGPRAGNGTSLLHRLSRVRCQTELLKNAPDILINYLFCIIASKYFPESVVRQSLDSAHTTAAFSNIPGPSEINILNGCKLKDVIFWLPSKGYTGIGISVLSYGDRLHLGLSADTALIDNSTEAREILLNMEKYIREMDQLTQNISTAQEK